MHGSSRRRAARGLSRRPRRTASTHAWRVWRARAWWRASRSSTSTTAKRSFSLTTVAVSGFSWLSAHDEAAAVGADGLVLRRRRSDAARGRRDPRTRSAARGDRRRRVSVRLTRSIASLLVADETLLIALAGMRESLYAPVASSPMQSTPSVRVRRAATSRNESPPSGCLGKHRQPGVGANRPQDTSRGLPPAGGSVRRAAARGVSA